MLILSSTSDKIQVITTASSAIKVHATYIDNASGTITAGRTNTASITSNTTTDVVDAPASSTIRNVKFLSVRNDHASTANGVTIQHTDGTTTTPIWQGTLSAGESVNFSEGNGWSYLDSTGNPKLATAKLDTVVYQKTDLSNALSGLIDATDLKAPVQSGKKYKFTACVFASTSASTVGEQFAVNGPAMTTYIAGIISTVTNSVTSAAVSAGVATTVNTVITAQTTGPGAVNSITFISGMVNPSADGTLAIRFQSETGTSMPLLKGSWLHVRELDN